MSKSREWLLYNAVLTWLHYYAEINTNDFEIVEQYLNLKKELQFEYEDKLNEQPDDTETRKRGRPAKRQRTQKATSNPSSTEKSKTTNQET